MRRQKAVYWRKSNTPTEYGGPVFDAPVEIDCRWESHLGHVRDKDGELIDSKATIYVDRPMQLGDMLMLGELEEDTPADPRGMPDAYEIQGFEELPNLRATETLYTAHL